MALTKEGGERLWQSRWEDWKARASEKHQGAYAYPSAEREGGKIRVVCKHHGDFMQLPAKHMHGQGCPKCSGVGTDKVAQLAARFPNWDWSDVSVTSSKGKLTLVCPEHGEFETQFNRLMTKGGDVTPCPKCSKTIGGRKVRVPGAVWDERVLTRWGDAYTRVGDVTRCQDLAEYTCKTHGRFLVRPLDLVGGHGCPKCASSTRSSRGEKEIADYIQSLGVRVETHNRTLMDGYELDIYLPDYKVGIEHCGMYWHGDRIQTPEYHQEKLTKARLAGVRLLTVFEDEWLFQTDKVMFALIGILGFGTQIGARETRVEDIEWGVAREFLNAWHMMGHGLPGELRQGVFYQGELVAVAVWGKKRFGKPEGDQRELYRLCIKAGWHIRGVVGKLVAAATAVFKPMGVRTLVTYADLRWGTGEGYRRAGFNHVADTKPGYFWCKGLRRITRQDMQKHKLKAVLPRFDEALSEAENCRANGYWRVYDCGNSKWEKQI